MQTEYNYLSFPILYGSKSTPIAKEVRENPDITHMWELYIRSPVNLPLDFIRGVTIELHESFAQPMVSVPFLNNEFVLKSQGWGEFEAKFKITVDDRVIKIGHELKLSDRETKVEKKDSIVIKGASRKLRELYKKFYKKCEFGSEENKIVTKGLLDILKRHN